MMFALAADSGAVGANSAAAGYHMTTLGVTVALGTKTGLTP